MVDHNFPIRSSVSNGVLMDALLTWDCDSRLEASCFDSPNRKDTLVFVLYAYKSLLIAYFG